MALLKVDNLTVADGGAPYIEGVSFAIGKGQRLAVIGETGAGKSVLVKAIVGLLPPAMKVTGTISFDDAPMPAGEAEIAKLRGKRIGLMLQESADALDPLIPVGPQLAEALTLAGQSGDLKPAIAELLKDIGLDAAVASRYPRDLSPGERRLVMLAIALAGKPDLLIADDPTVGLDSLLQKRLTDLILKHANERGMGLLLVSHDLKLVALLSTKVLVLTGGKAVESGEKAEVFGHPKHVHTRLLVTAGRHRARTLMRTPIGAVLLDVRNVSRRYRPRGASLLSPMPPVMALDSVSLAIRQGESLALVGPAGSGKSTLARIIAGLEDATSGELEVDHMVYHGRDLPRIQRRDISFVFHDPMLSFNPRLTVGESIAEPLQLESQRLMDELSARIVEMIRAVGLSADILTRYPHEFTAAQRQRLAIARALITRPRLIILDEPVTALDIAGRGELLVMLNRLRADFGLTFLVISHDLEMVRVVADRVMVMDRGRIIEASTPAQLLESPQQPLSQQLVAATLPDVGIVPVF